MYKVNVKLSLERGGRFVLSQGRARLLKLVRERGSISAAAKEMGMSYRHAWGLIQDISEAAGAQVVTSDRGGSSGGGTRLTKAGEDVLDRYMRWEASICRIALYGPKPALTVDGVVVRNGKVLLVERGREPFKGGWALPGGFVEEGETLELAVEREVLEETGVRAEPISIVGVYSDPGRDPRGHTVSVAYMMRAMGGKAAGGDDAARARWFPLEELPELAFDHSMIVEDAKQLL